MDENFPYIEVPEEALDVIGKQDPGTRLYRASGPEEASGPWFEIVNLIGGPIVSPGEAGMFAPVSRAAVHKRLKEGKLTAFCFHVASTRTSIFGKERKVRDTPFVYIPSSELKA